MASQRSDRHQLYMGMAELAAQRSTCQRGQVGAIIVKDKRVVSLGYNGAPPGMPHCLDVGCELLRLYTIPEGPDWQTKTPELYEAGCQRAVHAEANAIDWAAREGIAVKHATMYCTHSPCRKCAQQMASAGIACVIFKHPYRATPWKLLEEMGITYESVLDL